MQNKIQWRTNLKTARVAPAAQKVTPSHVSNQHIIITFTSHSSLMGTFIQTTDRGAQPQVWTQ